MSPPTTLGLVSSKDSQTIPLSLTRPATQASSQPSFQGRQSHPHSHARNSSHSAAAGPSLNATHRITRRKSLTSTAANREAVVAALKENGSLPAGAVVPRRRAVSKTSRPGSPSSSLPAQGPKFSPRVKPEAPNSSAIDDEQLSLDEVQAPLQKARARRASDGQPLLKDGRKGNRVELRCEKCGKGYKHSSCLTKHLWEHTPQWSYTSKLLISKHQQVQLLEAASVLVAMNNRASDETTPPESAKDFNTSDHESASPAASGDSDHRAGQSSADTTPPPRSEVFGATSQAAWAVSKRHSSASGITKSLQAAAGSSIATSAPNGPTGLGHFRQLSHDQRPLSSGLSRTGRDDSDLAATLEMLSCSVGSNGSPSAGILHNIPPVPPLPAQYLDQIGLGSSFMTLGSFPAQPESFARGERPSDAMKMEDSNDSAGGEDDDFDKRSRARSDEDDDGVFGRMEE